MRPLLCAALLLGLLSGCAGPDPAGAPEASGPADSPGIAGASESAGQAPSAVPASDIDGAVLAVARANATFSGYTGAAGVRLAGEQPATWNASAALGLPVEAGSLLLEADCSVEADSADPPAYSVSVEMERADGRRVLFRGSGHAQDGCSVRVALDADDLYGRIVAVGMRVGYGLTQAAVDASGEVRYAVSLLGTDAVPAGYTALEVA